MRCQSALNTPSGRDVLIYAERATFFHPVRRCAGLASITSRVPEQEVEALRMAVAGHTTAHGWDLRRGAPIGRRRSGRAGCQGARVLRTVHLRVQKQVRILLSQRVMNGTVWRLRR